MLWILMVICILVFLFGTIANKKARKKEGEIFSPFSGIERLSERLSSRDKRAAANRASARVSRKSGCSSRGARGCSSELPKASCKILPASRPERSCGRCQNHGKNQC